MRIQDKIIVKSESSCVATVLRTEGIHQDEKSLATCNAWRDHTQRHSQDLWWRGHVVIITKPSPHYVLTKSTISSLWH